ncbi:hypothetical protein DS6A_33 [Mycobacterium phage DS6A]|uniref:Uncharacterized protein n=1 Tax=Mycobacterium phage DS6A TaxID=45764 RepID=G8I4E3_9CAUD|nr:hypothetical protein DS6A_33 [Mycobacterium phage DS6A]AER47587.1 hypothetical protein DS6A_33 [Mycobacterium phage DS6A]
MDGIDVQLPTTVVGLLGLVVLGAIALLTKVVVTLNDVHRSTVNSHGTDLRHDVDKVLELASDIQTMVRGVRAEVHDEAQRRAATDDRLLAELDAERVRSIEADAVLRRDLDALREAG